VRGPARGAQLDESATTCIRLLRLPPLPELPEPLRGRAFVRIDGAINTSTSIAAVTVAPLRARPGDRHVRGHADRPAGPDPHGSAVDHPPGRYLVYAVGVVPNPAIAELVSADVAAARAALAPWTSDRDYLNSREAEAAAAAGRFYSADVLDRLRRVVAAVDPDCCSRRIIRCTETALSAAASAAARRACW